MIVASFFVHRPEEHPEAADYPAMLRILQRSCDRVGLSHVVLTDKATIAAGKLPEECRAWTVRDMPGPLMQACTEAQAQFLEECADHGPATCFVGADCIMRKRPSFPFADFDLALTYRRHDSRYPINTGMQFVPGHRVSDVAKLYRRIADRCGKKWCDDQRSLRAELEPMPDGHGIYERAGLRVAFVPMRPFNVLPKSIDDPAADAVMLHFRGKGRKSFLFEWAKKHGA